MFVAGRFRRLIPLFVLLIAMSVANAQIIVREAGRSETEERSVLVLPYVFSNETFGPSVGIFGVVSKYPQEQSSIYGMVFGSVNGSWRGWLGGYDFQLPGTERWFLSPDISGTDYSQVRVYVDGNPAYPSVRAGANDSDPEDYVEAPGWDGVLTCRFRYVMPWGHGRDHMINRVEVRRGMLHSDPVGARSWNPLHSGRSYLLVEPFYRRQELKLPQGHRTLISNGMQLEFRHDNTDFVLNPADGGLKRIAVTRDFGWFNSTEDWTQLEMEYRKFIGLGESALHRQRVLALNVWASDVPSWKTRQVAGATLVTSRPPYYEGSTLGGFGKMRAYPVNRFSDRSAIYYSAEFRAIPEWNPLSGITVFGSPEVDWWQWVVFAEAGRVADSFDLKTLHSDLHFDAGVGIRAFSSGMVGRLDLTIAAESWALIAMVGHAF